MEMAISSLWSNTVSGLHLPPDRIQARTLTGGQDSVSRCSIACSALMHKHMTLFPTLLSCILASLLSFNQFSTHGMTQSPPQSFTYWKSHGPAQKLCPHQDANQRRALPLLHASCIHCPHLALLLHRVLFLLVTEVLLCACLVVSSWGFNM